MKMDSNEKPKEIQNLIEVKRFLTEQNEKNNEIIKSIDMILESADKAELMSVKMLEITMMSVKLARAMTMPIKPLVLK